jgi:hypothetical protein
MIVSEQQLLVRYFKLGAVLALAGSIHILTLLLPWYVVKSDTVSTTILTGYILPVTLLLSVAGGVLAGISLLATSFSTKVNVVRLSLTSLALAGGLLALLSPLYMAFISIPNLGVGGAPDIGFYGAALSAVVVIGLGVLAIVTKPKGLRFHTRVTRLHGQPQRHRLRRPQWLYLTPSTKAWYARYAILL